MNLYTNPSIPGSFAGLSGFKKNNPGASVKKIKQSETYSLHKSVRRKFPRRKTIVNSIDSEWQVDLIDMKKEKFINSHYQYLLTCVDVLSKFAWVEAIKDKTAAECAKAFEKIFKQGRIPKYIYSDLGTF
jgi:hypothetical protein